MCVGLSQNICSEEHANSFWHRDGCSNLTSCEIRLKTGGTWSMLPGDEPSDAAKYKDNSRKTFSLI